MEYKKHNSVSLQLVASGKAGDGSAGLCAGHQPKLTCPMHSEVKQTPWSRETFTAGPSKETVAQAPKSPSSLKISTKHF